MGQQCLIVVVQWVGTKVIKDLNHAKTTLTSGMQEALKDFQQAEIHQLQA